MSLPEPPASPAASSSKPPCAVCNTNPPKYTCPRCHLKSCSLQCSTAHKATSRCSGVRDKAAFVPMNTYGWGAMVDDYVFLEDVGRKVGEWGREIVRDGLARGGALRRRAMDRGRGMGMRGRLPAGQVNKRDFLSLQLTFRDIDMDVLPPGMERHRVNQSTWDSKNKTPLLTIEFILHPPPDPLKKRTQEALRLLSHRNRLDASLRNLIQGCVRARTKSKKDTELEGWLLPLVCLDPDDGNPTQPLCVMKRTTPHDANATSRRAAYHKLDWSLKLAETLHHTHFVEFPTIEVMDTTAFAGMLVDSAGVVERDTAHEPKPKRRRLDARTGKRAITDLLADYGTDEDEDGAMRDAGPNALSALAYYDGSNGSDGELSSGDGPPTSQQELDPLAQDPQSDLEGGLLDLEVFDPNAAAEDMNAQCWDEVDDDEVDWGDSADEDEEARLSALLAAAQHRSAQGHDTRLD